VRVFFSREGGEVYQKRDQQTVPTAANKASRSVELVSDDDTFFFKKNFQSSKLNQSTRVVQIDVYYTIRPFKRTPGTKVD